MSGKRPAASRDRDAMITALGSMTLYSFRDIRLQVLILDGDSSSAIRLQEALRHPGVASVICSSSVSDAASLLARHHFNTVFVDPLSGNLTDTSAFIFETRKAYPDIVFCLYFDPAAVQARVAEFYYGQRVRFRHYYTLNKNADPQLLGQDVDVLVREMQNFLAFNASQAEIQRLMNQLTASGGSMEVARVRDLLDHSRGRRPDAREVESNAVFVAYRKQDRQYVDALNTMLRKEGFAPHDGFAVTGYVGTGVLDEIRSCEFFLALMTKEARKESGGYTTSPWLLEEKGAALAFGKKMVLLVQDGVEDFGNLQGDLQRIHFKPKNFASAALDAVTHLRALRGEVG
jgi:hypothetical protein